MIFNLKKKKTCPLQWKRRVLTTGLPGKSLIYFWWECKMIQSLWKTFWKFLKRLNIELPYDPAIPLPNIYP